MAWTNVGGTPGTATTPTAAPTLTITQNLPSISVTSGITSICSDGSTRTPDNLFVRNIDDLSKKVLGVSLTGATNVDPPSGYQYSYNAVAGLSNPNYSLQWSVLNGTIVNTYSNSIAVLWDQEMTDGLVQLIVTNTCPGGEAVNFDLEVSNKNPDIP